MRDRRLDLLLGLWLCLILVGRQRDRRVAEHRVGGDTDEQEDDRGGDRPRDFEPSVLAGRLRIVVVPKFPDCVDQNDLDEQRYRDRDVEQLRVQSVDEVRVDRLCQHRFRRGENGPDHQQGVPPETRFGHLSALR